MTKKQTNSYREGQKNIIQLKQREFCDQQFIDLKTNILIGFKFKKVCELCVKSADSNQQRQRQQNTVKKVLLLFWIFQLDITLTNTFIQCLNKPIRNDQKPFYSLRDINAYKYNNNSNNNNNGDDTK